MPSADRKAPASSNNHHHNNNNNNNVPAPAPVGSNQAPPQQPNVITKSGSLDTPMSPLQQVLVMVDKKVRNLDKRKTKLEQLKEQSKEAPKELTTEQRKALAKCEEVVEILEFFKDFRKSINSLFLEKAMKVKEQKEKVERAKEEREKIKNVLLIQELLSAIGMPEVRKALVNGTAGMEAISEERMKNLDDLYEILNPKRNEPGYQKNLEVAASRLNDLVDGKKKEAFKGVTFQELRDLIMSLDKCPILQPPPSSSSSNQSSVQENRKQQQQQLDQQMSDVHNVSPSPPTTTSAHESDHQQDQQQQQMAQQQPLPQQQQQQQQHNFVSFGTIDSSGTTDPAIVGIGFPPGVPITSAAGAFVLPVGAYPVPLQPGQMPPQFVGADGTVYQQQQPQQPDQSVAAEFGNLNLDSESSSGNKQQQVQGEGGQSGGQRVDNQRPFKGGPPQNRGPPNKHWNRGPRDQGAPRGDRGPRDNRTQGAPNDSQRYNNPRGSGGPREHNNNNFPNGGGFKGGNRGGARNNNFGPRAGTAAAAGGPGAGGQGFQKV